MNPSASDSQIKDYTRRPNRYENIDGTVEILFGASALGFWLAGEIAPHLPATHFWKHNLIGVMIPIYGSLALCWAVAGLVNRLIKRRITFPRTGYVAQPKCANKPRAAYFFCAVGLASALIGILVYQAQRHHAFGAMRIAGIAMFAGTYALTVRTQSREHRWKLLVAIGMALGLIALQYVMPAARNEEFLHLGMLMVALTYFASGVATLVLYIRRTHPPVPEGA
jgi:hypothetical protein